MQPTLHEPLKDRDILRLKPAPGAVGHEVVVRLCLTRFHVYPFSEAYVEDDLGISCRVACGSEPIEQHGEQLPERVAERGGAARQACQRIRTHTSIPARISQHTQ